MDSISDYVPTQIQLINTLNYNTNTTRYNTILNGKVHNKKRKLDASQRCSRLCAAGAALRGGHASQQAAMKMHCYSNS